MPHISDGEVNLPVSSAEVSALEDLRATVKWLVASAGGTAVVLVGGLQLTSLPRLDHWTGWISAVSAAIAIGLALALLTSAARILALPRLTSNEISNREINANALDPDSIEPINDELVSWERDHVEHLLMGERTVTNLCTLKNSTQKAARDLRLGRSTTWQGTSVTPADTETTDRILRTLREADLALIAVETTVHLYVSQKRFARLMRFFPWGAGLFVVAVMVFAVASASC